MLQNFWHLLVPAAFSTWYQRLQQNTFCIQAVLKLRVEDTAAYLLQRDVKISKRELSSFFDSLRDFLKTFDKARKCLHFPLLKLKVEIGSTKSKNNLFAHYYKDFLEHPERQISLSLPFGINSCVFSIKKFELHGNQFILTDFVINHRLIHQLYKSDLTLETGVSIREICSHKIFERKYDVQCINLDSRYDNCIIKFIGNVYCPDTICSDILCLHKNYFQSLSTRDCQNPQCESMYQVRRTKFPFRTNKFEFLVVWSRDLYLSRDKKTHSRCFQSCVLFNMPQSNVFSPSNQQHFQTQWLKKTAKIALTCWIFLLRAKNQHFCSLVVMEHIALQEKWVATAEKKNKLHCWWNFTANHNHAYQNLNRNKQKWFHLWHNRVDSPFVDSIRQKKFSMPFSNAFSLM